MVFDCWHGKILCVDLSSKKISEESISDEVYEKFLGGKGLGAYLLYTKTKEGIDPLGSDNIILFMTGPLQGLPAPNVGRWSLVTKSPLTGLFLDTHSGGPLGREIKKAGFDAVCVTGTSSSPVYLVLEDGAVRLEDAENMWGLGIYESTNYLHEQHSAKHAVYVIGPAGENQVLFATGSCEIAHQTGRGGAGAVLGSKRLKAIVAKGEQKINAADVSAIREVNKEINETWRNLDIDFKKYGTSHLVEIANEGGFYPTRNSQNGYFEDHEKLGHEHLHAEYGLGNHFSCPNCVMRCTHAFRTTDPDNPERIVESTIEYESLGLLGGNLGISDIPTLLQLNYLCDDIGLDTISAGGVIGFAMEAFEKGILTEEEIGFPLKFGDEKNAIALLKIIATKSGIGAILSQGVKIAAEKIGRNSSDFAVHVKGLEVPAWDPRGRLGMGLLYATGDIGASHLRGWPSVAAAPDSSAVPVVQGIWDSRVEKILKDSLIICHFTNRIPITIEQMTRALNGASGLNFDRDSVFQFAKRVESLTRLYNNREGISRKNDQLPPRFWEPQISGPRKGMKAFVNKDDFEASLEKYYEILGWDENGVPTKQTLQELGLDDL